MATVASSSVIIVDVKSTKSASEPGVATRLKARQPPARVPSAKKVSSSLAVETRAKVAAAFNERVQNARKNHALNSQRQQNTIRDKLEAKLQRGSSIAEMFLDERKNKATKVISKHEEVVSAKAQQVVSAEAEQAIRKAKLEQRLAAAESKRVAELEQIATRLSSQRKAQLEVVKARTEAAEAERNLKIATEEAKKEVADENRRKSLEAVRAKASVNVVGVPHSEVAARKRINEEQREAELACKLTTKLEAATKKHEDYVECIRSKAATVNSRAASVAEAVSTSQSFSPTKLLNKIQGELEAAESKRAEVIGAVRSKASKIIERHETVVAKNKELTQLRAKTAMLKIEVKLAAAESRRRDQSLSPRKSLSPKSSPRSFSLKEAVPFSLAGAEA